MHEARQGDGAASCQVKQALVTRLRGECLPPASDAVPQHRQIGSILLR